MEPDFEMAAYILLLVCSIGARMPLGPFNVNLTPTISRTHILCQEGGGTRGRIAVL
jgi:hypothetical protein